MIETKKLLLIGFKHSLGSVVIEAIRVFVFKGEKCCCSHQSLIDRVKFGPRDMGIAHHKVRGPVTCLPMRSNCLNVINVNGISPRHYSIPKTLGDRLFNDLESHHIQQILNLKAVKLVFDFKDTCHKIGQPVVAGPLAAAVPPLGQTNDGIGFAGLGQYKMGKGIRHRPFEVMGEIGNQQMSQEIPQGRILLLVPE